MSIQAVPNLIQGISQQSPQQRRDSQCESQFDCINSTLDGCVSRPPAVVLKAYPGQDWTGAFFAETSRDNENYLMLITSFNNIAVLDLTDGTTCALTGSDTDGYLAVGGGAAVSKLRKQTVQDTTFIVNRNVKPLMTSAKSPVRRPEAIVFVKSGAFDATFTVDLVKGAVTTTASIVTSASVSSLANAGYVATQLRADINGVDGYTCDISGSSLLIYRADNAAFTISTSDGNGDSLLFGIMGSVTSYVKLPARGFPGFILKVGGESRTSADDFYVEFQGQPSTGKWVEVVGPDQHTTLDKATMPHTLTNTGYRAFTWSSRDWSTRIAGDEEIVRDPSFVGQQLRAISWDENRLLLIHEAGAVWSKVRFPFTFFPDTAQALLATSPVDTALIAATNGSEGSPSLEFAVHVDDSRFIWAQKAQFRIASGQEPLRNDTIASKPTTSYEFDPDFTPIIVGTTLYFSSAVGANSILRMVEFQQGKAIGDIEVTSHVGNLLPPSLSINAASDGMRMMFLASEASPNIYIYNYLSSNRELVQSAWNVWRLPGAASILWFGLKKNYLRVLQQRPEGVLLLQFDLNLRAVDYPGTEYLTRLDLLVKSASLTATYNTAADTSTFTMPYAPTGAPLRVILTQDGPDGFTRGREYKVLSIAGAVVTVSGDLRGRTYVAGQVITSERTESEFFVRTDQGVVPVDRLSVNDFQLEFSKTGYTRLEVTTPNKPVSKITFEGRALGTVSATTEAPHLSTSSLRIPVGELSSNCSIRLVNDSFLPSFWQTASYDYTAVGRAGGR